MEGSEAEARNHGGRIVARALRSRGVSKLFTLSGGHLFSIYDGCREEGIDIVDVRHEQAAAFAAEGWAKATRQPGVCALTAGPGVTNGVSAMAGAAFNNSPVVVLGGRAPEMRWGSGSLQEIDHVPFIDPLVKSARTVRETGRIAEATANAIDTALELPSGPTFLDYPLDVVFMDSEDESVPEAREIPPGDAASGADRAAKLLAAAERPVIMAGTGLYWGRGEEELRLLAEALGIPVFLNGMGRGCIDSDHELAFSRARGMALKGADVALVVGVPLDFRLGFGGSFGDETQILQLDVTPSGLSGERTADQSLVGGIRATLAALREQGLSERSGAGVPASEPADGPTADWLEALGDEESAKRAAEAEEMNDSRSPLHPLRVYKGLAEVLDRDAIVIGDGGDFVSYAGRVIETHEPGCWMDPGPYGCLGGGPGQAIGAKSAFPDRQVVCLLGDGAFGFSGLEFDTMVRHGLPVVGVMGNNGIWALEKHPMEFLYGYSVAADLQPEMHYEEIVGTLGGHGEIVHEPDQLVPALERAFESGKPALVNVLTDPQVAYPRRSNLA